MFADGFFSGAVTAWRFAVFCFADCGCLLMCLVVCGWLPVVGCPGFGGLLVIAVCFALELFGGGCVGCLTLM